MATLLSTHFKDRRLTLGLRPGEVARRMGYKSIVGAANKIRRFEETGSIHAELFVKLALVLDIDQATVERIAQEDQRRFVAAWNAWADVPIRPHLVLRWIPAVYSHRDVPEKIIGDQPAMERYASALAKEIRKRVDLVISRRHSVHYDEDGSRRFEHHAQPGEVNGPFMRLKGSKKSFLFDDNLVPHVVELPTKPIDPTQSSSTDTD